MSQSQNPESRGKLSQDEAGNVEEVKLYSKNEILDYFNQRRQQDSKKF